VFRKFATFGAVMFMCTAAVSLPALASENIRLPDRPIVSSPIRASAEVAEALHTARVPVAVQALHAAKALDPAETTVSTRDLLVRLNQPWVQLIDIRSADEYAGFDIRALRGGHIPGARSVPLAANTDSAAIGAALTPLLATLDPRKETILYGHAGSDALAAAAWLEGQGFRHVRVYRGAWQTWGNALELPAADERFADVGALRERIAELQQAVQRLSLAGLANR
jgi:thiosulfate/3-mercaptopyruvate sulfurtransferase